MLMPLPNVALMSVAPNDSILVQFDIRVDARWGVSRCSQNQDDE